jgi:hypothetical protein
MNYQSAKEGLPMGQKYRWDDLSKQAVPKGGDAIA